MQSASSLNLIDTHAHCYLDSMKSSKDSWMENIRKNHIEKVLLPNIDIASIDPMHDLCDEYPNIFLPMMGLHPCDVKADYLDVLSIIQEKLYTNKDKYCGVGEIGLDYHWDTTFISEQKKALQMQFEWAIDLDKAVSIHSRKSNQDLIPMLTPYSKKGLRGVMHCFTGNLIEAHKTIDAGFYLGIGGVLTYPKAGLQEVIQEISLEHIVLETDSPYLPPVPHRGQQNESGYTKIIAEHIAKMKNISYEEVATVTTVNAKKCFQIL